ncbi:hypothetical protein MMC07_000601 [Pseudocyphellaria aurata]|nr:hypothetical protein [Pseudocyphellaria aurata]
MVKLSKSSPTPLKILMLHGFTQSGPRFHAKSSGLQKSLRKALFPHYSVSFSFPTAPHRIDLPFDEPSSSHSSLVQSSSREQDSITDPNDEPDSFGWWRRTSDDPVVYDGMVEGFSRIRETIRDEGPFDGVIGFSQGAAMAALVVSALEEADQAQPTTSPPRRRELQSEFQLADSQTRDEQEPDQRQRPLKFAVFYGGFRAADPRCDPFFTPPISTPTLHVLGELDTVVDESRMRGLVACCSPHKGASKDTSGGSAGRDSQGAVVITHPGGHYLPSQRVWLDHVTGWIRTCLDGEHLDVGGKDKDERVEDMDVPF